MRPWADPSSYRVVDPLGTLRFLVYQRGARACRHGLWQGRAPHVWARLGALDYLCGCMEGHAKLVAHVIGVVAMDRKVLRVSEVATDKVVRRCDCMRGHGSPQRACISTSRLCTLANSSRRTMRHWLISMQWARAQRQCLNHEYVCIHCTGNSCYLIFLQPSERRMK